MKKQYCSHECDFKHYYCEQAGKGINVYSGVPYQRGYGFWGDNFKRYGTPVLKYLGKHAFNTGRNVANDVFGQNETFKESLKKRMKESGKVAGRDILEKVTNRINQGGTGKRKVKRRKPINKSIKRRKTVHKDIFH